MDDELAAFNHRVLQKRASSPTYGIDALREEARALERWLFDKALPLWWEHGADRARGGFEELLDTGGSPVAAPRRARVQARQIHVYAVAGELGWEGPWRAAMSHGLDYFLKRYFRPDGLVRAAVSASGDPADEGPVLYDQAFGLLALAAVAKAIGGNPDVHERARVLLAAIEGRFGTDGPGYLSGDAMRPFQSNPHMHLFEACLAWMACDTSAVWLDLATRIADLAMTRFVDPSTGALREFFNARWAPADGVDGRIVEPGHQFEWAWLLFRWGRMTGSSNAVAIADRLFEIGAGPGVDRRRNVAINALDNTFAPFDASARLWPQTERVKAAVSAAEARPANDDQHLTEVVEGVAGLRRYLLPNGTWKDKMTTGGDFIDEAAPASSLYHIVGAIAEVARAATAAPNSGESLPSGH